MKVRLYLSKITPELLRFYDYELNYVAEPGDFDIMIGGNSQSVKNDSSEFEIIVFLKRRNMKHRTLLTCMCGLILFGSCKDQPTQNEQPLEVMTFNIRLDAPSDSANNWKYRKDNVCKMIAYYQPDLLGMQEVCHNQMEDLKLGLPQYTALGVGRDDGKEAGEYCPVFFKTDRFTLVEHGNFSLSEQPETIGVRGWDASYNRITTWAILQKKSDGKKLVFLQYPSGQ